MAVDADPIDVYHRTNRSRPVDRQNASGKDRFSLWDVSWSPRQEGWPVPSEARELIKSNQSQALLNSKTRVLSV